jgi:hypothetical protein
MTYRFSTVFALVALSGVLVLAGCSSSKKGFALKGSVSYQGKPLSSGIIRLHMAENRVAMARIQPDGSFEATDLFAGEVKATVEEDPMEEMQRRMRVGVGVPKTPIPKSSPIPVKYRDVNTAGLVFTIASNQPLDITLQ